MYLTYYLSYLSGKSVFFHQRANEGKGVASKYKSDGVSRVRRDIGLHARVQPHVLTDRLIVSIVPTSWIMHAIARHGVTHGD